MFQLLIFLLSFTNTILAIAISTDLQTTTPTCGYPGLPTNSEMSSSGRSNFFKGESIIYTCQDGYVLLGPAVRECMEGGWSKTTPVCRENIALGQLATQSATLGDYYPGLAVDGDPDTSCSFTPRTTEKRWWQVQLKISSNIEAVSVTINSNIFQNFTIFVIELLEDNKALYKPCSKFDGVFVEPRAVFLCNEGRGHFGDFVYIKDGRGVQEYLSLCEVQVFPFRKKATCGFPEEPLHTLISQEDGVAIYSCEEGYILLGEEIRYCQEDGSWSGKLPMCIDPSLSDVECHDPVSPSNGYTLLSKFEGTNQVGSLASYRCNEGFELWGDSSSICGPDGSWDLSSPPSCHPIMCGDPPLLTQATVELLNSSTRWQSLSAYQCLPGYQDTLLDTALSQCLADGHWSVVSLNCAQHVGRPHANKVSVKTIVSWLAISLLLLMILIIISILLVRRSRTAAAQARKLARLASQSSDEQKDRILGILDNGETSGKKTVESGHVKVMKKYSVKNTRYHKTSPVLNTPSPMGEVSNEASKNEYIKEKANEAEAGLSGNRRGSNDLYSPMGKSKQNPNEMNTIASVMVDNIQELNTESFSHKAVHEDDYESVEFPDKNSLSLFAETKSGEVFATTTPSDLIRDDIRGIDNNSVLDFSAQKRNLVLGIDRKPEIKPLSIFKIDVNSLEHIESLPSEIDETESQEDQSEVCLEPSQNSGHDNTANVVEIEENNDEFIPSISENIFMRGESKKLGNSQCRTLEAPSFFNNTFVKKETTKYVKNANTKKNDFSSSNLKRNLFRSSEEKTNSQRISNQTFSTYPKESVAASQTKQLISKFDKTKCETGGTVDQKPKQLKSPTKLLISRFDNPRDNSEKNNANGTNLQFKPQNKFCNNFPARPKINPVTTPGPNTRNTSKVHQLIYAMNKTGFLQDKLKANDSES